MINFLTKLTIVLFIWMVFYSIVNKVRANEFYSTLTGDDNTLNIVQDGKDNYINLNPSNFEGADMEIKQNGDDNSVNLNISGGTGTGSSFYIYQNGNNKNYSNTLYCGGEWCTMTVTQN
tara:strand:- start:69 stop:425 length:357 start_codon:yes stop_codon:yes gene_type:complete